MPRASTAGRPAHGSRRALTALVAAGGWASVVPWLARALGLGLDVPGRLEVVDHVVPGAAVLGCAALLARARPSGLLSPALAGGATLAGLWITAAHATLLPEALDGVTPWGPALLHLSAGPPVLVVALWILLTGDADRRPTARSDP